MVVGADGGVGEFAADDLAVELGGFGLEGGVGDAVPVAEHGGEAGDSAFGAGDGVDFDVSAERDEAGGEGPDVEVMEGEDAGDGAGVPFDGGGIEAGRCAFEEDGDGVAQEEEGSGDDKCADEEADDDIDV